MLGCVFNIDLFSQIIAPVLVASAGAWVGVHVFYEKKKRELKETAYKEYIEANQALAAHMNEPEVLPTYQKKYFQACANVYVCGSERVLAAMSERHSNLDAPNEKQQAYFQEIVEAIRDDLKMEKTYNVIFHLIVVGTPSNANKVKRRELKIFLTCPHGHE